MQKTYYTETNSDIVSVYGLINSFLFYLLKSYSVICDHLQNLPLGPL